MKNLRGYKPPQGEGGASSGQSAEDLLHGYENMSEDALFETLMRDVASSKSNGTFSQEQLMESVEKMKPFLSESQVAKLNHLTRLIISN